MQFAYPHILWLLLVLPPALAAFFWWSWRKRQALMTQFIQARLLPGLTVGLSARRQQIRAFVMVGAVSCLIIALARPQWGFTWEEARLRGLDIVVAVDTSKSMLAEDIAPNRLARAKLAVLDLVQQAGADRLGLVAFAGSAFLQCPLTIDDAAFRQSLASLDVTTIPEGGTAIAAAIETALTAFKEQDNHKVLVIFTDGEDHDSGAVEAAKKAAAKGLKIFTIGIGSTEGEILRYKDSKGRTDYIRDEQGNVVKSRLNEDLLRQIAGSTDGGYYLPLRGARTIETLYQQSLANIPKSEHEEKLLKRYYERYHWPLSAAVILLLGEFLFPDRKREIRVAAPTVGRPVAKTATFAALLLISLSFLPLAATASNSSALRDYRRGDYDKALQEYLSSLERKSDDPRLQFNAGASAYRAGKLDEALKRFSEALNSPDLNLQQSAYYNRGNTLYYSGEKADDPAKRSEFWKKSVQDFESALKLNPKDADAKFNQDWVKQKLEELEKQQPKQQQQKDDQKNNDHKQGQQQQQPQQSQKDQQQQQEQQKEDQRGQQQQQDQQKQDQQQSQNQQQQQESQQGQQEQQPQPQQGQEKQQQGQQSASQDQQGKQDGQNEATAPGQMTPQEARQLLDSQKQGEKALPANPANNKDGQPRNRPVKDW